MEIKEWIGGHLAKVWDGVLPQSEGPFFDADEFFQHYIDPISVKETQKEYLYQRKEGKRIVKTRQRTSPKLKVALNRSI